MDNVITTITIFNENNVAIATIKTSNPEIMKDLIPSDPCVRVKLEAEKVKEGLGYERRRVSSKR